MRSEGVLVVGSANMDLVVVTERFPNPGETVLGKHFDMFPGGKGANQAVACARLGGKTVFLGKMGKDNFKDLLIESMGGNGVLLDHLLIDGEKGTGTALITVDGKGENEIIVISGSNMCLGAEEVAAQISLFQRARVVLTQLEIPLPTVLKTAELAKQNEAIFILNPAPANTLPRELLALTDFLTPNETELELLSGKRVTDLSSAANAARELVAQGVKNVVVTMGEQGALLVNKDGDRHYPARKVVAVDTTAAGDAFNGAMAFSLAEGRSIEKAIELANAVAGIAVTKMGAQSSLPKLCDVE